MVKEFIINFGSKESALIAFGFDLSPDNILILLIKLMVVPFKEKKGAIFFFLRRRR